MSVLKLKVTTARPSSYLIQTFQTVGAPKAVVERLSQYLLRVSTGSEGAQDTSTPPQIAIVDQSSEVAASGTVIFSNAAQANDQVIINGVTLTAVASGATNNQWNIGTGASGSANGLVAAINASTTALINTQVTAAASSGTVTITADAYSYAGNSVTIAKGTDAGSVMTVSGARLTGGVPDAGALTVQF